VGNRWVGGCYSVGHGTYSNEYRGFWLYESLIIPFGGDIIRGIGIGLTGSLILRIMGDIYQCVLSNYSTRTTEGAMVENGPGWPSRTGNQCDSMLINQQRVRGHPSKALPENGVGSGGAEAKSTQDLPQWVLHAQ
jgi:hypothetical protein